MEGKKSKISLAVILISFLIGLVAGISGTFLLSNRYDISTAAAGVLPVRIDKLTGNTWISEFIEKDGKRIWSWVPIKERTNLNDLNFPLILYTTF